ncbi:ubiquitin conjugation factor e4 a [Anaeramoeba flamelloides]|uniref:Ubiquitin conjugation factor e4 a n=1 Tax=Anaeramoeba flamelloides TaxID=1746091 RepID=A0ABQ8Y5I6_9EUKA|nr:ubiquitin conjugation factor e4 a [Anaeramoeba flamelloides]
MSLLKPKTKYLTKTFFNTLPNKTKLEINDCSTIFQIKINEFHETTKCIESVNITIQKECEKQNYSFLETLPDLVLLEIFQNYNKANTQQLIEGNVFYYLISCFSRCKNSQKLKSTKKYLHFIESILSLYFYNLLVSPKKIIPEFDSTERYQLAINSFLKFRGDIPTFLRQFTLPKNGINQQSLRRVLTALATTLVNGFDFALTNNNREDLAGHAINTLNLLKSLFTLKEEPTNGTQNLNQNKNKNKNQNKNLNRNNSPYSNFSNFHNPNKYIINTSILIPRDPPKKNKKKKAKREPIYEQILLFRLFRFSILKRTEDLMKTLHSSNEYEGINEQEFRRTELDFQIIQRTAMYEYLSELKELLLVIFKKKDLRERFFLWVHYELLNLEEENELKRKEREILDVDLNEKEIFVFNLCQILTGLCEPFIVVSKGRWKNLSINTFRALFQNEKKQNPIFLSSDEASWIIKSNLAKFTGHQLLMKKMRSIKRKQRDMYFHKKNLKESKTTSNDESEIKNIQIENLRINKKLKGKKTERKKEKGNENENENENKEKKTEYEKEKENENKKNEKNEFITKCFYLANKSIMLALVPVIRKHLKINLQLTKEKEKERRQRVKQKTKKLIVLATKYSAIESLTFDPLLRKKIFSLYQFLICWIYANIGEDPEIILENNSLNNLTKTFNSNSNDNSNNNNSNNNIEHFLPILPFNEQAENKVLKIIPEAFISNMGKYVRWFLKLSPRTLFKEERCPMIMNFLLSMSASSGIILNPFIRHGLMMSVQDLIKSSGRLITDRSISQRSKQILLALEGKRGFVLKYLPWCLLNLFIDVEFTGTSSQYYDKLRLRKPLLEMLLFLLRSQQFLYSFRIECQNYDLSLRVVGYLLTDLSTLINLASDAIGNISELSDMVNNQILAKTLPFDEKIRINRIIIERTASIRLYGQNARKILDIMVLLVTTCQIESVFLSTDLRGLLIETFSNLLKSFGKYELREKKGLSTFDLDPHDLLKQLCFLIIEFSHFDIFLESWATRQSEQQISKKSHFTRIKHIFGEVQILTWEHIINRIFNENNNKNNNNNNNNNNNINNNNNKNNNEENNEIKNDSENLYDEEFPEEFLCALLWNLMEDPVKLPSGSTVDRQNIEKHLMFDSTDPFSRQPLTLELMVPLPDLKIKIIEWKKKHLIKK